MLAFWKSLGYGTVGGMTADEHTDTSVNTPINTSINTPTDTSVDVSVGASVDTSVDARTGVSTRWPARPAGALTVAVIGRGQAGKSTTVAALGDELQALTGWNTVLVDLDATALLSKHLVPLLPASGTTEDGLTERAALHTELLRAGLAVVPAGPALAQAEVGLDDTAVAQRLVLPLQDAGWTVTILDTQAMRPMVKGAAPLLRGAIDAADVVVVPFGMGSKNADHLELALADLVDYQAAVGRRLPILLLPTMVDAADRKSVEAAGVMVGAVGRAYAGPGGFRFLPAVKRSTVVQRSEYDHRLLASVPSRDTPEVVRQYQQVAQVLADVLTEVE